MDRGHKRTIADHEDMALRQAQRGLAEATMLQSREQGLRTARVLAIDKRGNIQLDIFSDSLGGGLWFPNLNHTQPFPGESVIWSYVDGSPAVLGPVSGENRPWRVPLTGMPDAFHFDDFDTSRGAFYGTSQLTRVITGSGSSSPDAGTAGHPGQVRLSTGGTSGSDSYLEQEVYLLQYESLDEVEFMFSISNIAAAGFAVGLSGGAASGTNSLFACFDTAMGAPYNEEVSVAVLGASGWGASPLAGSGSLDPSIPIVAGHWYKTLLRRLDPGTWMVVISDVSEDPQIEGVKLVSGVNQGSCSPVFHVWNNAAQNKRLDCDYLWWSKRRVNRT